MTTDPDTTAVRGSATGGLRDAEAHRERMGA